MATHSAKCDEEGCEYVAVVHAHDEDIAAEHLSVNLAEHNKKVHDKKTLAEEIKGVVQAKMKAIH